MNIRDQVSLRDISEYRAQSPPYLDTKGTVKGHTEGQPEGPTEDVLPDHHSHGSMSRRPSIPFSYLFLVDPVQAWPSIVMSRYLSSSRYISFSSSQFLPFHTNTRLALSCRRVTTRQKGNGAAYP
jgi:hypothetical protein